MRNPATATPTEVAEAPARQSTNALPVPWRKLVTIAFAATAVVVLAVLVDVHRYGSNPLNLIQPGAEGPSRRVVQQDFPTAHLPSGVGFDGQMFYAIGRQPMHLDRIAPTSTDPDTGCSGRSCHGWRGACIRGAGHRADQR